MRERRLQKRRGILLVSFLLATSGCFSFGSPPEPPWLEGNDPAYPPSRYLLGVGQGDSAVEATNQAYAAVAKVFRAHISAETYDRDRWQRTEGPTLETERLEQTLERSVRLSTEKELQNVRVLDTWFDSTKGVHYVLVGLARAQAETALLEQISAQDRVIEAAVQQGRLSKNPLHRARYLSQALEALRLRHAYNDDLRVIRSSGRGVPPPFSVAALKDQVHRALARISIAIHVNGTQADPARHAIIKGLIAEGLSVSGNGAPDSVTDPTASPWGSPVRREPDLVISGTVRVWQIDLPDPTFKYVRWCSDFIVKETNNLVVVAAASASGREGHLTVPEAVNRAVDAMQRTLATDVARTIVAQLNGDSSDSPKEHSQACAGL